jgi:hypothetical protein
MNVRLFMLIAMIAFFGAIWSSDRQFQENQMAIARAARSTGVERKSASAGTPVAPPACIPPTAVRSPTVISIVVPTIGVSSIAESATAAPTFAAPSIAEPTRQPVVAPQVAKDRPIGFVSLFVSFRRPSFYFEGNRRFDDISCSEEANPQASGQVDLASLFRWAGRILAEIDGETCWMRCQMRRTTFYAQRRVTILLRERLDWYALAEKIARGTLWQFDAIPTNAAAPATGEKR